jgi:hypothetical protein
MSAYDGFGRTNSGCLHRHFSWYPAEAEEGKIPSNSMKVPGFITAGLLAVLAGVFHGNSQITSAEHFLSNQSRLHIYYKGVEKYKGQVTGAILPE